MTTKIERTKQEIEKARARIAAEEARLSELLQRLEELENTEIVRMVRVRKMTPQQLDAFLKRNDAKRQSRTGELPHIDEEVIQDGI